MTVANPQGSSCISFQLPNELSCFQDLLDLFRKLLRDLVIPYKVDGRQDAVILHQLQESTGALVRDPVPFKIQLADHRMVTHRLDDLPAAAVTESCVLDAEGPQALVAADPSGERLATGTAQGVVAEVDVGDVGGELEELCDIRSTLVGELGIS